MLRIDFIHSVWVSIKIRIKYFKRNLVINRLKKQGRLEIGHGTYGIPFIRDIKSNHAHRIIIGKFCSIGENVQILQGGEHRIDWVSTYPFRIKYDLENKFIDGETFSRGDTVLGNDVWIGDNVFIRGGVTIGDGAVIGACSMIVKNVAPYEVVGGNPAKHIRMRFSEEEINALLAIKWWNWPEEKILANLDTLSSSNLHPFIDKFKSSR